MSDLQVGEAFRHRVLIIQTATGLPWTLQAPTVVVVDESNNQAAPAAATEESNGYYHYDFTPDAAGTWTSTWALAGATFYHSPLIFKVGGGEIADIKADTAAILTDTGTTLDDLVDDLEGRLTAARAGYLDELAAANIPTDLTNIATKIDTVDDLIDTEVAAIDTKVTAVNTDVGDWSARANLTSLLTSLGIPDVAGKDLYTCIITDRLDHGTYGLSALETLVDGLESRLSNHLVTRTWFSDTDDSITCNTDSTDLTLPSVVLPNITGTIVHAYAGIKFRMIENTAAGGTNGLNGVQDVQVKESVAGAYTDAINLADNQWLVAASTREGGDCVIGDIDVVGQVAAFNKTYNFIIDDNDVDLASLVLADVQTFLVVSYY